MAAIRHHLRGAEPTSPDTGIIPAMSARTRFAVAAGIVALSIGGLIAWALSGTTSYYRTPQELLADPASSQQRVRVAGKVIEGSIVEQGHLTRFDISDGKAAVPIETADALPDTFGEGVEVVAEGGMTKAGVFSASSVLAKCPSKFKAKQTSASG